MARVFAVSDIHGEMHMFMELLDKLALEGDDRLYILGDVVDRGDYSIELLMLIKNSDNLTLIKGNHEEMFLDCIVHQESDSFYMLQQQYTMNGGGSTWEQFKELSMEEQESLTVYLKQLPLYKVIDDFVLVHSGINSCHSKEIITEKDMNEFMNNQDEDDILWSREDFYSKPAIKGFTIVFGHTPTQSIFKHMEKVELSNPRIWFDSKHKDKIGIDCGAVFKNGKLACLSLDTLEVLYID